MSLQQEQQMRLTTVRSLLAKAEHENTPAPEAEPLSAKAAELMEKYSIDQAMLDAAAQVNKPATVGRRVIAFAGHDFIGHKQDLLHAIAEHNACTTVVTDTRLANPQSF